MQRCRRGMNYVADRASSVQWRSRRLAGSHAVGPRRNAARPALILPATDTAERLIAAGYDRRSVLSIPRPRRLGQSRPNQRAPCRECTGRRAPEKTREAALKPQNLLILMSDEHNARMMGCAGHPLAKTPHLDALAERGTRFVDASTTCPICVPARASFATGRYVHDIGYWDNSIAYDGRVPSWGHRLQDAGLRVESIGKLHYRREQDPCGFDRQHIPMHITDGVGMIQLSIRKQFPDFVPPPRRRAAIAESAGMGGLVRHLRRLPAEPGAAGRTTASPAAERLRHDAASPQASSPRPSSGASPSPSRLRNWPCSGHRDSVGIRTRHEAQPNHCLLQAVRLSRTTACSMSACGGIPPHTGMCRCWSG